MKKKLVNYQFDWTKTDAQLSRETGLNQSTVNRRRHAAGVAPVQPHVPVAADWASQPWSSQNDSQIAQFLGCSKGTVALMRKRHAASVLRPRHPNFCWDGQDWTQHDNDIAIARGLTRGAVSSARARHAKGVRPSTRKPGKRQAEQAQATIHAEERKTVHEWLNQLGTPTHEKTGLQMCLLRRLAVQLGIQPYEP